MTDKLTFSLGKEPSGRFGVMLWEAMNDAMISADDLGLKAGTSKMSVYRWLEGKSMYPENFEFLVKFFDLDRNKAEEALLHDDEQRKLNKKRVRIGRSKYRFVYEYEDHPILQEIQHKLPRLSKHARELFASQVSALLRTLVRQSG